MGLFDKFKKKNVESVNEKTETAVDTKPDDTFERILDRLYGELANTIISTIPMEWEEFNYLGEVESGKHSWSSVFFVKGSQDNRYIRCFDLDGYNGRCSDAIDSVLLKIYDCFVRNNHKAWEQMCISVKNTGDFKVDFKYDVLAKAEYGQVEREIIWEYETFGGRPHNSPFLESILERYLAKRNYSKQP